MGKALKPGVTIKGTKDGLLFFLDDSRPFSAVLNELKYKLEHHSASQIWDGPEMKVKIKLGQRRITKPEEIAVRELFSIRKNLIIHEFESDGMPYLADFEPGIQMLTGTVRSGQVLTHTGDLLFLGDVNPGGTIQCTGSIYVLGALRGLAHAGSKGDETAIIAASVLRPTQLRIADVICRPPDQWDESEVGMRFACLADNQIIVEKMHHLSRIRPDKEWKENSKKL
ncbi:septum site-determining protein MinC [Lihuaxuella thermophila]|uniref:Probable septum site-determining protein MinC n=1 Tax=Lihuaxuella thermophila TaxID=1173111 RepID=A0A1H8FS74_9BACL|nr:septum site-determining protein MinC [Lihuaxuella thermophila]SEN34410.1 septum site-determining protein MinC [Lihuaxuella thermophila]